MLPPAKCVPMMELLSRISTFSSRDMLHNQNSPFLVPNLCTAFNMIMNSIHLYYKLCACFDNTYFNVFVDIKSIELL